MMNDADILAQAKKHAKIAKDGWSEIYAEAKGDLDFLSDTPGAQWDDKEYQSRKQEGRPVITVDQLSQFVHQVTNDIRMNTPTIKTIPHAGGADVDTADVLDGLIKDIEYQSSADEAYDTAASFSVKCSIGFIRVDHEYHDDETFDQRLSIRRVVNPQSILIDPSSIEIDGSDGKFGFVLDTLTVSDFKEKYPNQEVCSFWDEETLTTNRSDEDEVIVADYYVIEESKKRIAVSEDGEFVDVDDDKKHEREREVTKKRVRRHKLSGKAVLAGNGDDDFFPGKYIPIIPVYGEEAWRDGKRHLLSLIRKAKSPAAMYNLWKSLETEILMKQPLAPVMAAPGQTESFAADWKDPSKAAVLRYKTKDADGNLAPPPQRLMPPIYPAGFAQASRSSIDDIKGSLGMYNASIGQRSNESSGIAINARKAEGDVATYHYGDNLVKSITQVGRILVSAIPVVYDSKRIVRTIGEEDTPNMVGINGATTDDQERTFDLTNGSFSVRVITGAPFTTQRQEAAQFLTEMASRQPALMQIAGDILFKNMDFPGAQALAARVKKTIPKELLEGEDGNEEQVPDPEKLQMQQVIQQGQQAIEQLQQEAEALKQQLNNKQVETELKVQSEQNDTELEAVKLRIEKEKNATEAEFKAAEIALKNRELDIRIREIEIRSHAQSFPPQNI
jgi:hypothetical protein